MTDVLGGLRSELGGRIADDRARLVGGVEFFERCVLADGLEVEQLDAVDVGDGRVDVAGKPEVDDEAAGQGAGRRGDRLQFGHPEDDVGRDAAGDDEVGCGDRVDETARGHRTGGVGDGEFLRPARRRVHVHVGHAALAEGREARAGVCAGSDEEHPGRAQSVMRLSARSSARRTIDRPALVMPVRFLTPREVRDATWKSRSSSLLTVPDARAASSARRTWPAISPSPTTTDSSPLETEKRCSATPWSLMTALDARSSSASTPDAALTALITVSADAAAPRRRACSIGVHVEVGLETVAGREHDGSVEEFGVLCESCGDCCRMPLQPVEEVETGGAVARGEAE